MMNRQYPKKAATLVTNRGMFLANCTKHVIFDLVKFNPGKFFIPCLLKSTDTRLSVLLFFSYLKSYFLRLFETVSYSFLACSRRSDSGEGCEVKGARKNKSKGGGEVRPQPPSTFHPFLYFAPLSTI